ncbi:antiterminator Q family protein [Azotobacter salinestris]|uniref:antiterminator Q family protein n=1 Tax=Azotobacter salinestris TaxID=69964 RepID=UPI00244E3A17|nr:antiterminator Q family protein [Azotobacter salinestris]
MAGAELKVRRAVTDRTADYLLTQWGKWVWQNTGVPRYVSPLLALMRDNVPSTHGAAAAITDDEAEAVSAAVARLKSGREDVSDAIHLYYCYSLTQPQVAERMQIQRMKVRELLIMGEWYVQAWLDKRAAA